MLVWCKLGPDNLTLRASAESGVKVGDRVQDRFDPARASIFEYASGNRI